MNHNHVYHFRCTQIKEEKRLTQDISHKTGRDRTYQGHPVTDLGQPGTDKG